MADKNEVEVIHMWSSPRSVSTSLMYSFAQRDDTEVVDEPLYAHFVRVTGTERPYREYLLSNMESDGNKVVNEIIYGPGKKKYRFCKHIASQRLPGLPDELLKKGKHFLVIRDPIDVLTSYNKVIPPKFIELGYASLVSIFNELSDEGKLPPVVQSDFLREDPEATLRGLCEDLGIPFQAAMLKWEPGPKPYDGLWASYWYGNTHKSTGFASPNKYPSPFPSSMYNLLELSLPFYSLLLRYVKRTTAKSLHPSIPVPANEKLLVWVGDQIVPRESAMVSVFDSIVQGGDGVWEDLCVYNGKIFILEEHLDRLFDSAKALAFSNIPTRNQVKEAIFKTLIRNRMFDDAHVRVTLTRGKKATSGMSSAFNLYGCTLIVLTEWKPPVYDNAHCIKLATATTRCSSPNIEGNNSGADDSIMLDKDGYVSGTNAINIFLVIKGCIASPQGDYCLPGITRATVIELIATENLVLTERRISISEFHTADEVFATNTSGELSPVIEFDGRTIGDGKVGPVTRKLLDGFRKLSDELGVPIPTYRPPVRSSEAVRQEPTAKDINNGRV